MHGLKLGFSQGPKPCLFLLPAHCFGGPPSLSTGSLPQPHPRLFPSLSPGPQRAGSDPTGSGPFPAHRYLLPLLSSAVDWTWEKVHLAASGLRRGSPRKSWPPSPANRGQGAAGPHPRPSPVVIETDAALFVTLEKAPGLSDPVPKHLHSSSENKTLIEKKKFF